MPNKKLTEDSIIKLIQSILGKKSKITLNSNMDNIENWDSLNHLKILEKLDKVTKGKVAEISDIATASSVKEMITILKRKKLLSK